MISCPDEQRLSDWADADQAAKEGAIAAHLSECADCRLLVDLIRTPNRAPESANGVRPGDRLGHFEIQESLGRGGMGQVFVAVDTTLGRKVAIKVLARSSGAPSLIDEARTLAALQHEHVATVYAAGVSDGVPWLAMELLPGGTLRDWLGVRRSPDAILRVFAQLAHGLAAAHQQGVLHCDFKPENVLFTERGVPRIADFGLSVSRARGTASTGGTRRYLAPERLAGQPPTEKTDQFAFGETLRLVLELAGHPAAAARIVARLTARNPGERFPDLQTAARALEQTAASAPRRRLRIGLALLTLLLGVVAGPRALRAVRHHRCAAEADRRASSVSKRIDAELPGVENSSLREHLQTRLVEWTGVTTSSCEGGLAGPADAAHCLELVEARTNEVLAQAHVAGTSASRLVNLALRVPPAAACQSVPAARAVPDVDPTPRARWTNQFECSGELVERLTTLVTIAQRSRWPSAEAAAWNALGRCHRARGEVRDTEFALEMTAKLLADVPAPSLEADVQTIDHAGLLIVTGHFDQAAAALEGARAIGARDRSPWIDGLLQSRLAHLHRAQGHHSLAVEDYRRSLAVLTKVLPADDLAVVTAETNLADSQMQTFEYQAPLQTFLSQAPDGGVLSGDVVLLTNVAECLRGLGRSTEALPLARAAVAGIEPGDWKKLALHGDVLLTWAMVELEVGDPRRVADVFDAYRRQEPRRDDRPLHVNLRRALEAEALVKSKAPARALALLEDGDRLAVCPPVNQARCLQLVASARAHALSALGRHDEAAAALRALPLDWSPGLDPLVRARTALDVFEASPTCPRDPEAAALVELTRRLGPRGAAELARAERLTCAVPIPRR